MKIDIDFDDLLRHAMNASIDATIKTTDMNPSASENYENFERIAKISAGVTVQILREYHERLESSLDTLLSTRQ